jgi:transcriptional accessory protein Tex/SPT6
MKIRVPPEDITPSIATDILDMTRIHIESYSLAIKIAWDAYCDKDKFDSKNISEVDKLNAVRQVISNPDYLAMLDLLKYKKELSMIHQQNMVVLIDLIHEELKSPFKDPRLFRTVEKAKIPNSKLLLMLIEETE